MKDTTLINVGATALGVVVVALAMTAPADWLLAKLVTAGAVGTGLYWVWTRK